LTAGGFVFAARIDQPEQKATAGEADDVKPPNTQGID
jgi:hypothetical protein